MIKGRKQELQIYTITRYGSTLYNIGMDEVLAHYACTFENSNNYVNLNDVVGHIYKPPVYTMVGRKY